MRKKRKLLSRGAAAVGLAGITAPFPIRAASTLTWDANPATPGIQGGAGTWANGGASNWFNGTNNVAWNNTNVDSAVFGGTGGAINVSGTIAAKYFTVSTPGYTFSGGLFTFTTIGNSDAGIVNDVDTTVASGIQGSSGADGISKDGVGTLTLTGDNSTYNPGLYIRAGTVSVANAFSLPGSIRFSGPGRLLYTGPSGDLVTSLSTSGTNIGTIDIASAGTAVSVTRLVTGSFIKTGLGTLSAPNGTSGIRIDQGAFLLDKSSTSTLTLNGGGLLLHANSATNFANAILVTGNAPGIIHVDRATSSGTTNASHTLASLSVTNGATVNLQSANGWSLSLKSLTNAGTINLGNTLLQVTTNALSGAAVSPTATFGFGHNDSGAAPTARGLWVTTGAPNAVNAIFAGQSEDADLLLGVKLVQFTLGGAWRGGGASATSTLAFNGTSPIGSYNRITLDSSSHFNDLTADRAALRPVVITGNGTSNCQLVFDPSFVADHSNQGAIDDGLGQLQLANVNWWTSNSKSLPVVSKRITAGSGATHRAGLIIFDNGTTNTDSGVIWQVNSTPQSYDGGVNLKQSAAIAASAALTFNGRVASADNQFQIGANRILTLSGGLVTFSGDMGCAPGSQIKIGNLMQVNFNADPGAGWYEGNYTRGIDGGITSTPAPSHTLSISVGSNFSGGYTAFTAPATHLNELFLSGKSLVGSTSHACLISIGSRLSVTHDISNYLGLSADDAAILRASAFHTSATVRSMIMGKDLRDSQADASHGLGYARAGDVLTAGAGGTYSFFNETVGQDDILVRSTLTGDANLDGTVDFLDLARLAQSYNVTDGMRQWSQGDFNYDGNTDFLDLARLAQNYNTVLPGATIPAASAEFQRDLATAFAVIPEPTALPTLLLTASLWTRPRRDRRRRGKPGQSAHAASGPSVNLDFRHHVMEGFETCSHHTQRPAAQPPSPQK